MLLSSRTSASATVQARTHLEPSPLQQLHQRICILSSVTRQSARVRVLASDNAALHRLLCRGSQCVEGVAALPLMPAPAVSERPSYNIVLTSVCMNNQGMRPTCLGHKASSSHSNTGYCSDATGVRVAMVHGAQCCVHHTMQSAFWLRLCAARC